LERECVYLVDVRLEEEFEEGHLPMALSCPAGQLANAVDEFLPVRDAHLVCYSSRQTRARIGAALLSRIGYRTVSWLEGGLSAWRDDSQPMETGPPDRYLDDLDFVDESTPRMRPAEAARAMSSGAVLVDVRRSSEYALCHVPGSTWIPRGDLERRARRALPTDQLVVVLSDRMLRSALAARTLRSLGYDSVVLDGGLTTWLAEGWPTEEGLQGANVSLQEAKVDAELVAARPKLLERSREDMERYLDWEERLGIQLLRGQAHQEVTEDDRQR
jgi:rhodanese-related sulfurtransferase